MPKSISLILPSAVTSTFDGLMSRCRMECRCAWPIASHRSTNSSTRSRKPSFHLSQCASSVMPSTSSMAYLSSLSPVCPLSSNSAMCAWRTCANSSRSSAKHIRRSGSNWPGRTSLTATRRATPTMSRSPSITTPMPPRPSSRVRAQAPSFSGSASDTSVFHLRLMHVVALRYLSSMARTSAATLTLPRASFDSSVAPLAGVDSSR